MSSASTSAAGAVHVQVPELLQIQHDCVLCGPDVNYHVRQRLGSITAAAGLAGYMLCSK